MQRLISFLLTATMLSACVGEIDDTEQPKYVSLQDFFVKNAPASQKFSGNSSNDIFFTASKGTRIQFPPNAFVTQNGTPVTGDVNIEVQEILNPMDMILSNKTTVSNGLPLESGGEFYIRATKNSEVLKLAPNTFIRLNIPVITNGMKVFNGVPQADGNVNWVENTSPGNFVFPDSLSKSKLFADSVGWINADKFYADPKITFTVLPGNCPLVDSTKMYIHLTGRNTVIPLTKSGISDKLIAAPATIVAICVKGGNPYSAIMPVVLQNGQSVTLNFSSTTEQVLKQKLQTLH